MYGTYNRARRSRADNVYPDYLDCKQQLSWPNLKGTRMNIQRRRELHQRHIGLASSNPM